MELNHIYQGDSLEVLKTFPDESIDCVVTSPPYWGLRDYGVDGQLGLEPDFRDYIKNLCNIFDEVKRVLKSEGTCWVNLGDTYNSPISAPNAPKLDARFDEYYEKTRDFRNKAVKENGLPAKTLVQIPSRFAIEMTRRRGKFVKSEEDCIWLAAMIDGEGCVHIHKRENGRKNATYGVFLSVHNSDKKIIDKIVRITGLGGNIQITEKDRRKKLYRWNALSNNARTILEDVYPYLVSKQEQARCALFCPSSGKVAEECLQNIKSLHHDLPTTRFYPEPKIEGRDPWILRNEIIWAKPNCMPSSVKDRFTVDFEKIFFFTKSKQYYFEQQKEPIAESSMNDKRRGRIPSKNAKWDGFQSQTIGKIKSFAYIEDGGRNMRSVWRISPRPYKEAHFATFPEDLITTPIKAGCPPFGVVLDPFFGSGTTGAVAKKLVRHFVGIELNPEYIKLAEDRISGANTLPIAI